MLGDDSVIFKEKILYFKVNFKIVILKHTSVTNSQQNEQKEHVSFGLKEIITEEKEPIGKWKEHLKNMVVRDQINNIREIINLVEL